MAGFMEAFGDLAEKELGLLVALLTCEDQKGTKDSLSCM